jgi:hypothetical protein
MKISYGNIKAKEKWFIKVFLLFFCHPSVKAHEESLFSDFFFLVVLPKIVFFG